MAEKLITCPVCGGSGVEHQWTGENSISSSTCKRCNGLGDVWVPMTNADRIRAMSDEELAEFLCGVYDCNGADDKFICGTIIPQFDEWSVKEWLRQPADSPDEDDRDSGLVEE